MQAQSWTNVLETRDELECEQWAMPSTGERAEPLVLEPLSANSPGDQRILGCDGSPDHAA